jgi:hypothetical protein
VAANGGSKRRKRCTGSLLPSSTRRLGDSGTEKDPGPNVPLRPLLMSTCSAPAPGRLHACSAGRCTSVDPRPGRSPAPETTPRPAALSPPKLHPTFKHFNAQFIHSPRKPLLRSISYGAHDSPTLRLQDGAPTAFSISPLCAFDVSCSNSPLRPLRPLRLCERCFKITFHCACLIWELTPLRLPNLGTRAHRTARSHASRRGRVCG